MYNALSTNYLQLFWTEQAAWSQATFGADDVRGPDGPAKHLAREVLTEILGIDREDVDAIYGGGR